MLLRARLSDWRWIAGMIVGIGTHALFLFTVCQLFSFLQTTSQRYSPAWMWVDGFLAIHFAVWHSLLLYPPVRQFLQRWIHSAFYGLMYCATTCVCLLMTFGFWQGSSVVVWQSSGIWDWAVSAGFFASWLALLYSLSLTGLGYQTGLTPWWYWSRGLPSPRREFNPRGAYLWLRHPVYLSFLGLIWFTSHMTLDHLLLTGVWTFYIFVGSYLKDERLAFYLGSQYRKYQGTVPGYPALEWGPLGRRSG